MDTITIPRRRRPRRARTTWARTAVAGAALLAGYLTRTCGIHR